MTTSLPVATRAEPVPRLAAVPVGVVAAVTALVGTTRIWWHTGRTAPWERIWDERRSLTVS